MRLTAVRTRQSSGVRYRRFLVSSFMVAGDVWRVEKLQCADALAAACGLDSCKGQLSGGLPGRLPDGHNDVPFRDVAA